MHGAGLADAPLAVLQYWDRQEASVDGVLGGFGHVSDADIDGSRRFLLKVCSIDASVRQCAAGSTLALNNISSDRLYRQT